VVLKAWIAENHPERRQHGHPERPRTEADYAGLVTAAHNQLHAPMILGLGNLSAADVDQLTAIIKNRLKSIQYRPALIDAFLAQTGLSLEPEPP